MHIFWIFVIPKLLCVLTYLYVLCSIWKFTIITMIKYCLYHDNELIILIIDLSKLSHSPSDNKKYMCTWVWT